MPIEIRELNISATVSDAPKNSSQQIDMGAFKKKVLEECVEEVLKILEEKKER